MNNCQHGLENIHDTGRLTHDLQSQGPSPITKTDPGLGRQHSRGRRSGDSRDADKENIKKHRREDASSGAISTTTTAQGEWDRAGIEEDGRGKLSKLCPNYQKRIFLGNSRGSLYVFGKHFLSVSLFIL